MFNRTPLFAMRHLRWQVLIALLGMLLIGRMLAGKGTAVQVTSEPVPGGVYTEALIGAPRHFNPLLDFGNSVDRDIDRLVFSGLTRFDTLGRPKPDLADWIISDDELSYTFVLRADATWHDGAPLTSEDVAFTVGLMQDPSYPGPADVALLWHAVKVEVVNSQTVLFTLPEPFAPFLDYTTFGLLPAHILRAVKAADLPAVSFNRAPVGSGPFKFENLLAQDGQVTGVLLSVFEGYLGPTPLLNEVGFKFYQDFSTAFAAYQAGDVLGLSSVDEAHVGQALALPQLGVYTTLRPEYSLIFLNLQSDELPFFKDKKVRQALLRGLNRAEMVSQVMHGQAVVADSPVLPGSWAHNPNLPHIEYDPDSAARLLESAGWLVPTGAVPGSTAYVREKDGVALHFILMAPNDDQHLALANSARATWAKLGVKVEVTAIDPTAIRNQYLVPRPRAFQALLVDMNFAGTPDPDPYPLWHETQIESGQNYGGLADRVTSELLEQGRITTDREARARLYFTFQSRFADQTPALLLFYPVYNYAVDASVKGVQVGSLIEPSDRFNGLAQWSVVTRRVIVEQPVATP